MPASESVSVVTWPSIELLHHLVRTFEVTQFNTGRRPPVVSYRAKIKLHGTNCAIQVRGGQLHCQGRTTLLSPNADNRGFARWVGEHTAYFLGLPEGSVLYGEWCGPGVEKGVAISSIPRKIFAVFALQRGFDETSEQIVDPDALSERLRGAPEDLRVLPWESLGDGVDTVTIDFSSRASLEEAAALLDRRVSEVEADDPFVRRTFGVGGTGEGLVLYPVTVDGAAPQTAAEHARAMFKAKGEKHRTVASKRAVTVDPETVASADAFAELALTEARLQQGLGATCGEAGRDRKKTGAFLAWVLADVRKECADELEASHLTWEPVERLLRERARRWFLMEG